MRRLMMLVAAVAFMTHDASAQVIAPCTAIMGADSVRADKCIPVTPSDTAIWARSMGQWTGKYAGACTKTMHDLYSAVGPDGKRYPVWHSPVDTTDDGVECYYEHEHRMNPALSPLDSLGPVLFGYVNEQGCDAVAAGVAGAICRMEDHVGHKVEVRDTVLFDPTAAAQLKAPFAPLHCNVLTKLHQGTHSSDAFTNNLHEQTARLGCDNGWVVNVQRLSAIGRPGTMQARCNDRLITTGAYVPENSPTRSPYGSMGDRFVPSHTCVDQATPNEFENWKTQNVIYGLDASGRVINVFRFAFYWFISDPQRIHTPAGLRRMIDMCFAQESGEWVVRSNPCLTLRKNWDGTAPIPWDDPRSPFHGTGGSVRFNDVQFSDGGGPDVFYTDVLGEKPSVTPFPGSVQQFVSTGRYPYPLGGSGGAGKPFIVTGVRGAN